MQITSVSKVQKHHLWQLTVKIPGKRHHIVLIKSGDAQIFLHPLLIPRKVCLSAAVSLDEQRADLVQNLLVGNQRITALQNTEQAFGIVSPLPGKIHHLQENLLLHDAVFDREGQHLLLKEIQLAQHCRIHTEDIPRLNINHRRSTVMDKQIFQKQPSAGDTLHILLGQIQ